MFLEAVHDVHDFFIALLYAGVMCALYVYVPLVDGVVEVFSYASILENKGFILEYYIL